MIHKEGKIWVASVLVVYLISIYYLNFIKSPLYFPITIITTAIVLLIINFFRNPDRSIAQKNEKFIFAPADGKVVVIEEVEENEYFKDRRIQVSIFMNPLNVHVNRYPISGIVSYSKYHAGKYLVAWDPKASSENERTTVVLKNDRGQELLLRQIAGALARRICCYAKVQDKAVQGDDFGFIKFGSRVDLFLPIGTKINVKIDQKVFGNRDVIAELI
jgi:phosphatidylserine decarboxylase